MQINSRFTPEAAQALRAAIEEAFGNEVLVAAGLDAERRVATITVGARGPLRAFPPLDPTWRPGMW